MIRTQIQLKEEQMNALKKIAAAKQSSIAELIRKAVDNLIKAGGAMPDYEERRKRALSIAGRFCSGKLNISADHDEYLAEAYKE
ncbi:MAG: ribbon-helix-helix protein, CopG family [Nitrospirota bacterium]